MALAARTVRPRYSAEDVRLPGMARVHCVGCGDVICEVRAAYVRTASLRPAVVILRCKKSGCHSFTRVEVPEEITG